MRHKAQVSTFGRRNDQRRALIRGLVNSLVQFGRIKTTVAKAKELRRHAERAVTLGRQGTLHARRLLLSRYPNKKTVDMLMADIAPKYKTTSGGYTRIIKLGKRPGDNAEMAFIEWTHYDPNGKSESAGGASSKKKSAVSKKTKKKSDDIASNEAKAGSARKSKKASESSTKA